MKKNTKKYLTTSILASTMIFAVGCDSKSSDNTEEVLENTNLSNDVNFEEDLNTSYGKVTNINNNQITLSLGTLNMNKDNPKNNTSEEFNKDEKPDIPANKEKPEMPTDGESPEMPKENDNQPNNSKRPEMITLNGEEKIITITDSIRITKMNMKKPGSEENNNSEETLTLSDISVNDILKVKYSEDNTTIESIEIMSTGSNDIPKDISKNGTSTKPE